MLPSVTSPVKIAVAISKASAVGVALTEIPAVSVVIRIGSFGAAVMTSAGDTSVTNPLPSTTTDVGSVIFVEAPLSVIRALGASSSVIRTSTEAGWVDSLLAPAI